MQEKELEEGKQRAGTYTTRRSGQVWYSICCWCGCVYARWPQIRVAGRRRKCECRGTWQVFLCLFRICGANMSASQRDYTISSDRQARTVEMILAVSFGCTCTGLYVPGSGFCSNADSRCGLPQLTCDCSMWTAHGNVSLDRRNLQGNRARPLRRQTLLSSVAYTSICKGTRPLELDHTWDSCPSCPCAACRLLGPGTRPCTP